MVASGRKLRAVGPDEKADKALSLTEASAVGDTLSELRAMRVRNAELMSSPNIQGRDFAALSRRQMEIGREIDALVLKARQEAEEDGGSSTPDEEWDEQAI